MEGATWPRVSAETGRRRSRLSLLPFGRHRSIDELSLSGILVKQRCVPTRRCFVFGVLGSPRLTRAVQFRPWLRCQPSEAVVNIHQNTLSDFHGAQLAAGKQVICRCQGYSADFYPVCVGAEFRLHGVRASEVLPGLPRICLTLPGGLAARIVRFVPQTAERIKIVTLVSR